jgi:beta-aspartyl-peptidase (threonine type)
MQLLRLAPGPDGIALAVHGGAGDRVEPLDGPDAYHAGLRAAVLAGEQVLRAGGPAIDAVCAAVTVLEDDELFNAGRGAALTAQGTAELDAAIMTGEGRAGAVTGCRNVRNPVLAARAVLERTPHVLMVAPDDLLMTEWGLEQVPNSYFVSDRRRRELERVRSAAVDGPGVDGTRHGTVGAVARDAQGRLAAATSTGGVSNQLPGRVGDAPVIGAGTFAADGTVAVSCTGQGEYFLRGVVAYDISARISYLGAPLEQAVRDAVTAKLDATGGSGGLIAAGHDGSVVIAFNSNAMFRGHLTDGEPATYV